MKGGGNTGPAEGVDEPVGNPGAPCARQVTGKPHAKTNTDSSRSFFATILVGFSLSARVFDT
jgi:hypothetical protein